MARDLQSHPHDRDRREHTPGPLEVEGNWGAAAAPRPRRTSTPPRTSASRCSRVSSRPWVDGKERTLRAGETLDVPRGAVHKMWNPGATTPRAPSGGPLPRADVGVVRGHRRPGQAPPARTRGHLQPHQARGTAQRVRRRVPAGRRPAAAGGRRALRARGRRAPPGALAGDGGGRGRGAEPDGSWVSLLARYTGMIESRITSRPTTFTIGSWLGRE